MMVGLATPWPYEAEPKQEPQLDTREAVWKATRDYQAIVRLGDDFTRTLRVF